MRSSKALGTCGLLLAIGAAYALWVQLTGLSLPCPIHAATGLLCPGCGLTRMCMGLLHLDLAAAFDANPFLLVTTPVVLAVLAVLHARRRPCPKWAAGAYLAALIAFGAARNLM